ncbi:MAG: ABC transporter permease subunit [[Clostridium] scindens]
MEQVKKETSFSKEKVLAFIARHGAIIGICCVLIAFQIIEPRFMRIDNILGVLNSSSLLIVMTFGMTMVMAVRGIDLSIAQVADAAGVVAAMLILSGKNFIVAILGAMLFGLLVGIINAVPISYPGFWRSSGRWGMMFIVRERGTNPDGWGAAPQDTFTPPPYRRE